jgi:hypothetical protein
MAFNLMDTRSDASRRGARHAMPLHEHERDHVLSNTKPIADQIFDVLQRNPACKFDTLVADCSEFTWNQLYYEVDRMRQLGQLCLTSVGDGHYSIRLLLTEETMKPKQPYTQGKESHSPVAGRPDGEPRSVEPVDRHLRIAQRAYQLYEARGQRDGHALEHWVQAEREIRSADVPEHPVTEEIHHDA